VRLGQKPGGGGGGGSPQGTSGHGDEDAGIKHRLPVSSSHLPTEPSRPM